MSARRGLLIVLVLIALLIVGAMISARARQPIACQGGYCAVPQAYLAELQRTAALAEGYAFMCGWTRE